MPVTVISAAFSSVLTIVYFYFLHLRFHGRIMWQQQRIHTRSNSHVNNTMLLNNAMLPVIVDGYEAGD